MYEPGKIKIGVSACLLGHKVRYDGGHKQDRYITDTLGIYFDYVPVCPESECGLPIPREAMRLTGNIIDPRLVTVRTDIDHTERMKRWGEIRLAELENENLCGFIFKSRSPSSGMERVKVYGADGIPVKKGVGIWAEMFMKRFPQLPVEDEGRLSDPALRENFIGRVFVFKRWREMCSKGLTAGALVDFHTRHKLLFMAHSPENYRKAGKLVADTTAVGMEKLAEDYFSILSATFRLISTVKKNANVLYHILGYFKKDLSAGEKSEMVELIERYSEGNVPLIVPITLLNHYVKKYDKKYLAAQYYLNPHPLELGLRNHI